MDLCEFDRRLIARDWITEISERVEGRRRPDVLRRAGTEDGIRLVQDAIEIRSGNLVSGGGRFYLAITEAGIITPRPVEKLVASESQGGRVGIGFVIEFTVTKFCEARSRPAGDDLIKWIER